MPMYSYAFDDNSGDGFDIFQHMSEDVLTEHEGRPCHRTVQMFRPITCYGKGSGSDPIEMLSIAVDSPGEVREFRKRNPGVEISDFLSDPLFGVPIAKSRSEKLRILKTEKFAETN
jgi:hypothetical protein